MSLKISIRASLFELIVSWFSYRYFSWLRRWYFKLIDIFNQQNYFRGLSHKLSFEKESGGVYLIANVAERYSTAIGYLIDFIVPDSPRDSSRYDVSDFFQTVRKVSKGEASLREFNMIRKMVVSDVSSKVLLELLIKEGTVLREHVDNNPFTVKRWLKFVGKDFEYLMYKKDDLFAYGLFENKEYEKAFEYLDSVDYQPKW